MSFPSLKSLCLNKIIQRPEVYGPSLSQHKNKEAIDKICKEVHGATILPPSKEELATKLVLVHATDIFPQESILHAGAVIIGTSGEKSFETARKTVHFALGGLVQPHTPCPGYQESYIHSWENKKFAFVMPVGGHTLVHLFPADTFVMGNYPLPPEAVCVTSEANVHEAKAAHWSEKHLVVFTKETSLREAVVQYIKMKQAWLIVTKPNQAKTGLCAKLLEGPYRYFDLGAPYFYSSALLKENPISFGAATNNHGEGLGSLFKQFELRVFRIAYEFYHGSHLQLFTDYPEKDELKFYLETVPKILSLKEFADFVSNHLTHHDYNEWLTWVCYSLQLIQLDLTIRDSRGHTLAVKFEQTYPPGLFAWRNQLFDEILNTPPSEKKVLLDQGRLQQKLVQLNTVLEGCEKECFKKISDGLFFGEDSQLSFLKSVPEESLHSFIPHVVHIKKMGEDYGTAETLKMVFLICFYLDKYFLSRNPTYLPKFYQALEVLRTHLVLSDHESVFKFMSDNHYRLYTVITELFKSIDPQSTLEPLVKKFRLYLGIKNYLPAILAGIPGLNLGPPKWSVTQLKQELAQAKGMEATFIKNFFLCQLEIEFNVAQPYFSQDEILLSWQREAPLEFAALVEWLKSLPAEHEKGQRWLQVIESLPLRERQFRQEKKRFIEGIKQGSLLDY